jgi:hypothetical protein
MELEFGTEGSGLVRWSRLSPNPFAVLLMYWVERDELIVRLTCILLRVPVLIEDNISVQRKSVCKITSKKKKNSILKLPTKE